MWNGFFLCLFVSWIRRLIESVCLTSERRCATLNNNNKIIPMHDSSRMEPMSIPFDKRKTFHPLSLLFPASSQQPAAAVHLKEHRIRSAHNMKTQSDGSTTLYDISIGPVPRASISKFMCRRKKYHTKNRNLERMNRTQQKSHTHHKHVFMVFSRLVHQFHKIDVDCWFSAWFPPQFLISISWTTDLIPVFFGPRNLLRMFRWNRNHSQTDNFALKAIQVLQIRFEKIENVSSLEI